MDIRIVASSSGSDPNGDADKSACEQGLGMALQHYS
jgi:hypothetical protein